MSSYSSIAARARQHKEANPHLYCQESPICLWRTVNSRTGEVTPCRSTKHAHPTRAPEDAAADNEGKIIDLMAALRASLAEGV